MISPAGLHHHHYLVLIGCEIEKKHMLASLASVLHADSDNANMLRLTCHNVLYKRASMLISTSQKIQLWLMGLLSVSFAGVWSLIKVLQKMNPTHLNVDLLVLDEK